MNTLSNIRVRHSMLMGLYVQMKNYTECLERGYLGEVSDKEKKLTDNMKDTLLEMDQICWNYFEEEGKIIENE